MINNWLVELKATGKDYALMTTKQAHTSVENKDHYALIVVPLDGREPDLDFVKQKAIVISRVGFKLENVIKEFDSVQQAKESLRYDKDGVSVDLENETVRFRIRSAIWNGQDVLSIRDFIKNNFKGKDM
jgi:hypothetical protein